MYGVKTLKHASSLDPNLYCLPKPKPGNLAKTQQQLSKASTQFPRRLQGSKTRSPFLHRRQLPRLGAPIHEFLAQRGMEQCHSALLALGVATMQDLRKLSEQQLASLPMPMGYRLRLVRYMRELKRSLGPWKCRPW